MIREASGFVDKLEKLFPAEEGQRRHLVQIEIEDISDEESLTVLQQTTTKTDSLLADAIKEKVKVIAMRNYAREIKGDEDAKVRLGNDWSTNTLSATIGLEDRTHNKADPVTTKGSSTVHIGNIYSS